MGFRLPARDEDDTRQAVEEELAFHLEEMEEELVAEGMSPAAAREEALRRFGDLDETKTYCVDQRARRESREEWTMRIEGLLQDLKLSVRTLGKSPGYTTVVVLTLAVGIAANTVVFSLMNPFFFRPLPYGEPDRLVQLGQVDPRYGWDGVRFSLDMIEDYQSRTDALEGMAAYHYGTENVTGSQGPERVQTAYLTGTMFEVLRAPATLGRTFGEEEAGPGGEDVVVLSWGLWQRRWAGDRSVLGRTMTLDGTPHTIIGVMPEDFNFPFGGVKMWTPIHESAATMDRDEDHLIPVARLNPGWSAQDARAELERIQADLGARHPELDGRYAGISVKSMREALNFAWEVLTMSLTVLLAAVFCVLAIACVNVASLTLARARGRSREVAVRAAIGAGRGRIVRQLVTESLVLAALGGVLGVAAAYFVVGLVGPIMPEDLFRVGPVSVDRTVLLFTVAVTLATPLIFGLAPALNVARIELATALRGGGRGTGAGSALRGRRALVVFELALAVVLVTGTGLMLRSFQQIQRVDTGFEADRVLTVEVIPPESDYPSRQEYAAYFESALAELESLSGVTEVGQVYPLPLNHENLRIPFEAPGREAADPGEWPSALWAAVSGDYFRAMGVPVVSGRTFDARDTADGQGVVIISRSLAQRFFGRADPVGRSLRVVRGDGAVAATVVGVVGNVVQSGFQRDGEDMHIYQPLTQSARRRRFVVLHTAGDPSALAGPARRAMLDLDPDVPPGVRTMKEIVAENTYQWSVSSVFLGVFGLVAAGLAGLGVYGLVSYSVSQRRRELGVRMALGADASEIRRLVVGDALRLAVVGGGLGLILALGAGRVISSLLYGVSPFDPVTLTAVVGLFGMIGLSASFFPARRAAGTNPSDVLQAE